MNPRLKRLLATGTVLGCFALFAVNNYLIGSRFGLRYPSLDGLINSLRAFQKNEQCRENSRAEFYLQQREDFWSVGVYEPNGLMGIEIRNADGNAHIYKREFSQEELITFHAVEIPDSQFIQYGNLYLDIVDGCGRLEGYILRPTIVPTNPQEDALIQKT